MLSLRGNTEETSSYTLKTVPVSAIQGAKMHFQLIVSFFVVILSCILANISCINGTNSALKFKCIYDNFFKNIPVQMQDLALNMIMMVSQYKVTSESKGQAKVISFSFCQKAKVTSENI